TQFRDRLFGVGDPLIAPQEGLGLQRQTPDFRKLMMLSQAAVDPADPVNFAPYYALRPLPGIGPDARPLAPRPLLTSYTVGRGSLRPAAPSLAAATRPCCHSARHRSRRPRSHLGAATHGPSVRERRGRLGPRTAAPRVDERVRGAARPARVADGRPVQGVGRR